MVLVEAAGGECRGADAHAARVQCGGVSEHSVLVQSDGSMVADRLHLRTTESLCTFIFGVKNIQKVQYCKKKCMYVCVVK